MTLHEYPRLDEKIYRTTLSNGLDVMVVPKPGFSRKIAYFATDYGAVHTAFSFGGETYRAPDGIAHFLEHKLFDMPGQRDVSAEFAARGAFVNAFTSYDMTAYYFSCTENFADCLHLLLEFVSTPYFTKESVEKELGIIDQEIGMNEDAPDSRMYENLMKNAFAVHPIRVPILGTRESIREITPEMLHLCHRAFYTPGNMLLCVVGDVNPDEVEAIALEVLGTEAREVGRKLSGWEEPEGCPAALGREAMEVAMPMFSMLFKCPAAPHGEAGIRREMTADLAAEALFGESSQLYLRLYEEGLIDSSFGGGFEVIDGCSMLMVSGDSRDPEAVRDAILEEARRLAETGISGEDFRRMTRSALGRRVKGLDSFDSTCFRLTAYHMTGFDYFDFPRIQEDLSAEDLREFLDTAVRRENCSLSVIYPKEESYESD